jgi:hypothetical protein
MMDACRMPCVIVAMLIASSVFIDLTTTSWTRLERNTFAKIIVGGDAETQRSFMTMIRDGEEDGASLMHSQISKYCARVSVPVCSERQKCNFCLDVLQECAKYHRTAVM